MSSLVAWVLGHQGVLLAVAAVLLLVAMLVGRRVRRHH